MPFHSQYKKSYCKLIEGLKILKRTGNAKQRENVRMSGNRLDVNDRTKTGNAGSE